MVPVSRSRAPADCGSHTSSRPRRCACWCRTSTAPPYGVVVLADGTQERVTFTEELQRGVVRTMAEMRRMLETGAAPGPRWAPASWSGTNCRSGAECRDGTVRAYRFTNPSRRH